MTEAIDAMLGAVGEPASDEASAVREDAAVEEEALERAEHNALADVFDFVRGLSARSQLTEPADWEEFGLVPDHLTSDEFEMMVYEYVDSYLAEHKQERAAAAAEARAKACSYRSATTAVGISPFMREQGEAGAASVGGEGAKANADAPEGGAPHESVGAAAVQGSPVSEAAASGSAVAAGAAHEESTAAAAVGADASSSVSASAESAEASKDGAAHESVEAPEASDSPFPGLEIPAGYKFEEIEGEWTLVPDEDAEVLPREIDCAHIMMMVGQHSYYLYDESKMTATYARWAFLAAEDDPLMTFVDCVREESRTYPRPLPAVNLANPPFHMAAATVERTWEAVRDSGDYPDIQRTEASNGDVYYYSTLSLSAARAQAMAEYDAVERPRNV